MRDLSRLLSPRRIAVVGGGVWCENVIAECRRIGFDGALWPVHPRRSEVGGLLAKACVTDLPDAPDAAFVGVNRAASVDVVADLAAQGAGGAVCFASGFAEHGDGAQHQDALVRAAGPMPILGPNCYGLLNLLDGAALWPDHHGAVRVPQGVAIVTQSSNIAINLTMQRRGLPLAFVVTAGNQAQTGLAEIGAALLADDRVTALGLHIEGIDGPGGLEALAQVARSCGKPIVAIKLGRSTEARAATLSHTASLAGSRAGSDALFARLGIAQVTSLSAFLEALKLLHHTGALATRRIASMSCSGGEAGLVADAAAARGLVFPDLSADQQSALQAVLGPDTRPTNPLDYHTRIWGDRAAMADTFATMIAGDVSIGTVILDFPRTDRCEAPLWDVVVDAAADARDRTGKPIAILSSLTDTLGERMAERIASRGLIPLCGLEEGLDAIAAATQVCPPNPAPAPVLPPRSPADAVTLSEAKAKALLSREGLRVPRSATADGPEKAAHVAGAIGWPVALKGLGIAHKTEAGAVRLDLDTPAAVRDAAESFPTERYLVEEMIEGGLAELLVGILLDPAHGYVLTLAAGGTLTELMRDRRSLLLPVTRAEVDAALSELRVARLLDGWRGAPPASRAAILDAVMALQAFVIAHHGQVAEVEVNPLICRATDAVGADALISMEGTP
ncbi:MAG: acetate--CoA ligase family protein [Pseudomonadota bacterium]